MSLQLLPTELWLKIADCSTPLDFLSLGQTCRSLYDLIFERSIWEAWLEKLCSDRSLYPASFPHNSMSLLDLQRAVFAPHRWENLVRDNSVVAANFEPNLSWGMPEAVQLPELKGIYEVILVPGGRYVLGAGFRSEDHGSPVSVILLDLGLPGGSLLPNPPTVADCQISCPREYTRHNYKVYAAVDFTGSSALEVVVFIKPEITHPRHVPEPGCMAVALSVSAGDPEPHFERLGVIQIGGWLDRNFPWKRPSICAGASLLTLGDTHFIWRYRDGLYQTWAVQSPSVHEYPVFTGEFVVDPGSYSISLWETRSRPLLRLTVGQQVTLTSQNTPVTPPDYTVTYAHKQLPSTLSIPTTSKRLPIVFDVFHVTRGVRYKLTQTNSVSDAPPAFELQEITSFVTGEHKCYLPQKFHTEEYQFGYGSSSMLRLCVKGEAQGRELIYSIVENVVPGGSGEEVAGLSPKSKLMVADLISGTDTHDGIRSSICSTSGRMVAMDHEHRFEASLENVPRVFEFVR